MQLIVHRGTHEIGGNCVELRSGATRLVIDVGMPLVDANGESFDSQSLEGKSAEELLADGTLPDVPGLFDRRPSPDGILISHAHADHTGLLRYTRKEIPVYLSPGTSDMMYVALKFARQRGVARARQQRFSSEVPFTLGDFTITAHPVDHSAFDSMAFIIEAEGKRILYSGDLRRHGRKPGMARDLIKAARAAPIDVMLMEGTHISPTEEPRVTEQDLEQELVGILREARGIALACFSPLHVDRLVTFYRAATRADRTFVADPYAGLVMHKASQHSGVPDAKVAANLRVYYDRRFERSCEKRGLGYVSEKFASKRVRMDELRGRPTGFVMVFRPGMIESDFDGDLPPRARCVYSYWSGYLAKPQWVDLQERLKSVGGDFVKAHTSGHILPGDFEKLVREINPGRLVPIHTSKPEAFREHFDNVVTLADGEALEV
jgi:ribonuclease J